MNMIKMPFFRLEGLKNNKVKVIKKHFINFTAAYMYAIDFFDEPVNCKEYDDVLGWI